MNTFLSKSSVFALSLISNMLVMTWPGPLRANPEGGQVSAGQAVISAPNANTVQIHQSSDKAVIDWRTFNIKQTESTHFVQPNSKSITLNRVDPTHGASNINGGLTANGQIWLINPAGVIFGSSARVDAAGLLVTTANISNDDFMAGNYHFVQAPEWNGAVINNGKITIKDGGMAALVAPGVENNGVIQANLGHVILGATTEYTVDFYGDNLIQFSVNGATSSFAKRPDGSSLDAAISNKGKIIADGGKVLMTAKTAGAVLDHTINMSGYVRAKTAVQRGGSIVLMGGSGTVNVSGKMIASGKHHGQKGGSIKVLGNIVALTDKAKLDASGHAGGGEILIGGNAQGKGPEMNANYAFVGSNALINASAIQSGDGGKVVVWSDFGTQFYGNIFAKGGAESGNGGWVETSGKEYLAALGSVNASAAHGYAGSWLLDPSNVTIQNAVSSNGSFDGLSPNQFTTTANTAVASVGTINTSLNAGTSVTILTTPGGSQLGTITLAAGAGNAINKTGGGNATLTLIAADSITLNNTISSTSNALDVTLVSLGNAITINNAITTNGGNFLSTSQNGSTLAAGINAGAGTVTFNVNANGAGADNFAMNAGGSITTTNTTSSAVAINVNTSGGTGTGTATLRDITTGSGGTVTVNTNTGGDIIYGAGSINTGAGTVSLTTNRATGNNIGTSGAPIQITASNLNMISGSSGVFATSLGTGALTVDTLWAVDSLSNPTGVAQIFANGAILQGTNPVLATTLTLKTLSDSGAAITFNNSTNRATTINLRARNALDNANAPGAITYRDADIFTISGIDTTSTLDLTAGGTITQTGALTVSGTPTFTLTAGSSDISLAGFANNFATTPVITNNTNVRDLLLRNDNASATVPTIPTGLRDLTLNFANASSLVLPTITLTRSLIATANGPITQTGALVVPTNATFTAGAANNITLDDAGNNFGTILVASGNDVNIADSNALIFGNTTVSGALTASTATGTITDSGTLAVTGLTTLTAAGAANNITLNSAGNNFSTIKLTAGSATLVDTNALVLDASTLTGALTLTTGGAITQSGILNITGTTTLSAPAASDITLDLGNSFSTVAVTRGNNVTLKDINAVILGTSGSVATPLGSLGVTAGGSITQSGILRVTGTPTFTVTAAGSDISIASQANDFATTPIFATSGAGSITNLLLRNTNAGALVPTLPTGLNNLTLTFNNASSMALPLVSLTGNLSATANGPITQTGALTIAGSATFAAGAANDITLTDTSNNFASTVITSGNNVAITDSTGLTLGTSTVSGTYDIITHGALIQSGTQTITGLTTIDANSNNVTLATTANNFSTLKVLNGANVSLRDANSMILDDITASGTLTLQIGGTGNAITQAVGKAISASGTTTLIGTSANDITLANSGNDFATVATTSGNNVNLHDTNSIILGTSTISGAFDVTAGGTISQSGVLTVTGTPTFTVNAAGSDISLASSANNFSTTPVFTNNGNIRDLLLRNANNSALMPALPTGLRNLTLNFSGTNVAMALPTTTLTGNLSATATGAITQSGALSGATLTALTLNNSGAAITLGDTGNDFSTINLQARNAGNTANAAGAITYQDASGFDVSQLNTTSSATLTSAGNMTDSGALVIGGLTTLTAGVADITFDTTTNNFGTVAINSGNDVSLRDTNAIIFDTSTVGNSLTIVSGASGSAITQIGAITAPTLTAKTLNNAGGAITLDNAANTVTDIDLRARNTADTANDSGAITFNSAGSFNVATIGTTSTISLTSGNAITSSGNLTGSTLTTSSVNGTTLDFGNNLTGLNATNTTSGNISLTNTGTLSITGITQSGGGDFILDNTGTTTVTGIINTGTGNTSITSTGAVSDSTAGAVISPLLTIKTLANAGAAITFNNVGLHDVITVDLRSRNAADTANAAGAISYRDSNAFDVSALETNGTISLISDNGNINIASDIALGNAMTVNAGNGAIVFNGAITGNSQSLTLQNNTSSNGSVTFNDDVTLGSLVTFAQPYAVIFNGSSNTVTNAVTFNNTGGVSLLNNGVFNFTNGLTHTAGTTTLYGSINTNNTPVTLGTILLTGNSSMTTAGGNMTLGAISGGANDLGLNSGSSGDILFNGNTSLQNLTIFNTHDLTNNGTMDLASYLQNAGNIASLGTNTLNTSGSATITSNSVSGNMNIGGLLTINAETANGTVNTGSFTLNASGAVNMFGSVGGSTGLAAVQKITYANPPAGLQFFDGVDLHDAKNPPAPTPVPVSPSTIANLLQIFPTTTSSTTAMSSINLMTPASVSSEVMGSGSDFGSTAAANAVAQSGLASAANATQYGAAAAQSRIAELMSSMAPDLRPGFINTARTISTDLMKSNTMAWLLFLLGLSYLVRALLMRNRYLTINYVRALSFNLRTSLNNIMGFAEVVASGYLGPLSPNQKEYIRDILNNAEEMRTWLVKEIEENNHMAIELFNTLSFKIRTHLDSINGFIALIESEENRSLSEHMRDYMEHIRESANEISRLPNELLNHVEQDNALVSLYKLGVHYLKNNMIKQKKVRELSFNLRTSLNNIISSIEVINTLKADALTTRQKEFLKDILTCSNEMKYLSTDFEKNQHMTHQQLQKFIFDLRTELTNIMGFTGLLQNTEFTSSDTEMNGYLNTILDDSKNILDNCEKA